MNNYCETVAFIIAAFDSPLAHLVPSTATAIIYQGTDPENFSICDQPPEMISFPTKNTDPFSINISTSDFSERWQLYLNPADAKALENYICFLISNVEWNPFMVQKEGQQNLRLNQQFEKLIYQFNFKEIVKYSPIRWISPGPNLLEKGWVKCQRGELYLSEAVCNFKIL